MNLRARQYEPAQMRFSQPDVVRGYALNPQTVNRYAYCVNNPVMYADPSGETVQTLMQNIATAGQEVVGVAASGLNRLMKGSPKTIAGIQAELTPKWSGGTALTQGQKNTLQKQQGDRKLQLKTGPSALGVSGLKHMPYVCDGGTEIGHMSRLSEELEPKPRQTLLDMDIMEVFANLPAEEQRFLVEEIINAVKGEKIFLEDWEFAVSSISPERSISDKQAKQREWWVEHIVHYGIMGMGVVGGNLMMELGFGPALETAKKWAGAGLGLLAVKETIGFYEDRVVDAFTYRSGEYTSIICEYTIYSDYFFIPKAYANVTEYEIRVYGDYCEVWHSNLSASGQTGEQALLYSAALTPSGDMIRNKLGGMTIKELKELITPEEGAE